MLPATTYLGAGVYPLSCRATGYPSNNASGPIPGWEPSVSYNQWVQWSGTVYQACHAGFGCGNCDLIMAYQ